MRLDKILLLYNQSFHEGKLMKTPHVQQLPMSKITALHCRDHESVCRY